MTIILLTIVSALFFALTFLFRKMATRSLSFSKALLLEVIVELIILMVVFMFLKSSDKGSFLTNNRGVYYAVLAGIMVSLGVVTNILALKSGGLSKIMAIQSPSQIIFGVLLGLLFLSEVLSLRQVAGIILGIVAIILIV